MTRIKIKSISSSDRDRKLKLIEILYSNEVHITRVFTAHDGFTVLTLNEDYADRIFSRHVKNRLEEDGFNPLIPVELKVKKSVLDEWGQDEITEELKLKTPGLEMHLIPFINSKTLAP